MNAHIIPEDTTATPIRLRWVFLLPLVIPLGLVCITVWAWLQSWMGNPPANAGEYFLWFNIALVTVLAPLVVAIYVASSVLAFKVFSGTRRTLLGLLLALPVIALAVFWLLGFSTELGMPDAISSLGAVFFTLSLPITMFAGIAAFRLSGK